MAKSLPRLASKTFYKIDEGELTVHIQVDQISELTNQISLAIIIAALLIGSSLVMLIDVGPTLFDMPLLGFIGFTISLGAYIGLTIICAAIYAVVFFLILFVFGFFGIFTGTLGFAMAAGGIFVAGFFIAYFVMLFIVGPYTMLMQSRVSGLLYNLH